MAASRDDTRFVTWFGPAAQRLFGALDIPPDGQCRGAVVLCPPIGKEHVDAYRGVALLARKLREHGFMVLRFDYPGVGDSTGAPDAADAVERWLDSVATAVDYVRAAGAPTVTLVGLRVGGLIAAHVANRCGGLAAVVLWDPVTRGRNFLRRQSALYQMSVGVDEPSDPRISVIGAVLAPRAAAQLSALDLRSAELSGVGRVLVATRRADHGSAAIRDLVEQWDADDMALDDHDLFLEPEDFLVRMPVPDIGAIAGWIDGAIGLDRCRVHPILCTEAEVGRTADGRAIVESLLFLGEHRLFAIRTAAEGTQTGGPTLILYGTASEHRVGPVRMWVELSRDIAESGVVAYRFDRRGTGETGVVADDERTTIYTPESRQDAISIVDSVGAPAESVVLAGMCSGAWNSSYAALHRKVRAVVLVNMADWAIARNSFVKRSTMATDTWSGSGRVFDAMHRHAPAIKNRLRTVLPYRGWLVLGRFGLLQVPEIMLRPLWKRGVRTKVLLSPNDHEFFETNRGEESVRRLQRDGWDGRIVRYRTGDHSLYSRDLRKMVRADIVRAVVDAIGPVATPAHASVSAAVPDGVGAQ
ncbi:alpha/beta hydrolase [Rhodococcus sp. ABRD24]|uniref:alpha/beta fold hydrolase n=1 Tax=Rhodococcus sp. ABRD24 TaxID=2507582 RepID=UPI00104045BE|nr:alpha/beta fold hydrolase [Rhodococcus sp. ABRD24]QBJ97634.1 alpha/beta hydrolase [Rhodococcus sp. ABRD24]